jgi:hypothetical protein
MSRLRSRKFTSTNAACSFSDFSTPPEVQFEVPEVIAKSAAEGAVGGGQDLLDHALSIWNTSEPRPHPAIPYPCAEAVAGYNGQHGSQRESPGELRIVSSLPFRGFRVRRRR